MVIPESRQTQGAEVKEHQTWITSGASSGAEPPKNGEMLCVQNEQGWIIFRPIEYAQQYEL
jgi:hypothetical protein